MKLLVILSIKEYQERVASLLHDAGIKRFSVTNITGYKRKQKTWAGLRRREVMLRKIQSCFSVL